MSLPGGKEGSACRQPSTSSPAHARSQSGGDVRELLAPTIETFPPFPLAAAPAREQAHLFIHARIDREVGIGIEAHRLLGGAHLLLAERRAVRLGGIHGVRRGVGDVRADRDEGGTLAFLARCAQRGLQRGGVLGVGDTLHVPAVGGEARGVVLAIEGERRGAVDRDAVVVVANHELSQREVPRDRGGFLADALHQIAIGADRPGVVVDDLEARAVEAIGEEALGHREAHSVGEALPERPRGDLDAGRVPALGVPRRARAPLAEVAQVLEAQLPAAEVQERVVQHAGVPRGEHETVAIGPRGVGRIDAQQAREEGVREWRERHRGARVPGIGLLHRIHREPADGVDRKRLHVPVARNGGHELILALRVAVRS